MGAEEPAVFLHQERIQAEREQGQQERHGMELARVEDRDDGDGEEVVHDGEGEQEDAQRAGKVGTDDRQHGDGEGDVGGGGDRPAAQGLGACEVDGRVDERGNGHAAHGGGHRNHGFARLAQVARDKLALEFEPDQEEEDGQQAVGGPRPQAQVQVPGLVADGEVAQREVAFRRRGVGPDEGHHRCGDQQGPADGFLAEDLADPQGFGVAAAAENGEARRCRGCGRRGQCAHGVLKMGSTELCRPDFPAHLGSVYSL